MPFPGKMSTDANDFPQPALPRTKLHGKSMNRIETFFYDFISWFPLLWQRTIMYKNSVFQVLRCSHEWRVATSFFPLSANKENKTNVIYFFPAKKSLIRWKQARRKDIFDYFISIFLFSFFFRDDFEEEKQTWFVFRHT